MPNNISVYKGKVKIAIKKGNKVVKKSTHNAGLPDMAYLFSKAITGNLDYSTDVPRYLDIGYIVPNTESSVNIGDSGVWMSILNNPVIISGRQYKYEPTLANWVGVLTTTIFAQDLNGVTIDNVIENIKNGNYQLQIRMCSYKKKNRHYFAKVDIDETFIANIREATSAIITWYSELLYDENDLAIPGTTTGTIEEEDA